MLPDLGKYSFAVLGSYAVTFAFLGLLLLITLWRSRAVKRALSEAEARLDSTGSERKNG